MDGFWDFFWIVIVSFLFVSYLMVLFQIITDLFRDHRMSGWLKALWLLFLFLIPFLSALIYLIVRNEGMTERSAAAFRQVKQAQDSHIRDIAGKSPAQQIADAKALLDSGAITPQEFETLKSKALT
ncbi:MULTISPECIES: SHOCT domain-containing protein [Rhodococcus]|uniref:SHOCT domain-containing protein n=1 Tax=Rhodococcus jostii TaxID=132919 RepID=A0ABU4CAJ7_RHOJO|nr:MULTISPECIES: SHOCT domain-containing protein [Rhodococcus]MDI9975235.1 SHOCT domain-containing protein [Rhodococcus sp. IEGM 1307]MDV6280569.1 SHOCT domain-containing protein [Rhodococcus jostii]